MKVVLCLGLSRLGDRTSAVVRVVNLITGRVSSTSYLSTSSLSFSFDTLDKSDGVKIGLEWDLRLGLTRYDPLL